MKLMTLLAVTATLSTTGAALAAGDSMMGSHPMKMAGKHYMLSAQNGSKQNGTVTLSSLPGGKTLVVVMVSNPGSAPEPAHIHPGSCSKLNPAPKYPLTALVGGMSKTTVPAPMSSLVGNGFAVNVHKSAAQASTYVSCGDLK